MKVVIKLIGKVIFSVLVAGLYIFTLWALFFDWIDGFLKKRAKKSQKKESTSSNE